MTEGFDYDDIRGSVEKHLGEDNVGWVQIVTECFENIKLHCDKVEKSFPPVGQIKQKYGSLRIHLDGVREDPFIQSILREAVQKADRSCERCGNASAIQCIGYRYANLCCWHAHEAAAERMADFPTVSLNTQVRSEALQCRSCGYFGQISWGVSGHRCPACVSKGW
ncbi:hypothetical protein TRL7639_00055 [Falsiruegeria litorea R37]|uniref:Uncharacterized protein n=1 Tax=Falsiruegeria litorea R37 TaxID=1200284 RepID=A0A1Y5RBW6_9RHOB|nr:hypothetical protein [Falsiruegeria litorea]SLN11057.1 hypothetical protein TRL7639_00055 [Falsiruegeria litorea R37]